MCGSTALAESCVAITTVQFQNIPSPKTEPGPPWQPLPSPQRLATTDLLSVAMDLPFFRHTGSDEPSRRPRDDFSKTRDAQAPRGFLHSAPCCQGPSIHPVHTPSVYMYPRLAAAKIRRRNPCSRVCRAPRASCSMIHSGQSVHQWMNGYNMDTFNEI